MPITKKKSLQAYEFELFNVPGIVHGVFTRHGGVSPEPWRSLNHGGTVGDPRENFIENRRRVFEACDREVQSIYDVWQVHSADIICTEIPRPLDAPHQKADAILTNRPEVTLFMRFADCVPILLYDPVQRVVGLVHAGWQGTVKKIAAETISTMIDRYHSDPKDILAGIGPSIGPDHYPVGEEVIDQVRKAFPTHSDTVLASHEGEVIFNLWEANHAILASAGVQKIQVAGICTACHVDDWFSHRAEHGKTGRFGALIGLTGDSNV
jgi:polyphenol oxidase